MMTSDARKGKQSMKRFSSVLFTLLIASSSMVLAQAVDNNQAWEMVNKMIVEHIMGLDKTLVQRYAIQLPSADLPVTWDSDDGGMFDLLIVADEVPDWGPTWVQKNVRFTEAYGEFVEALSIAKRAGVTDKQLKDASDKWQAASAAVKRMRNTLDQEWAKESQKPPTPGKPKRPYGQWYKEDATPRLTPLLEAQTRAFGDYFALTDPKDHYHKLVDNYKNAAQISVAPAGAPEQAEPRYPFNASKNILAAIKKSGEANYAAKKLAISWSFDKDSGRRNEERESFGANASYGPFFSGSGGGSRYTLDIQQNTISLSYGAYALGYLPITPGSWYSGLLVQRFKNGPFKPNSDLTPELLWGPAGSLNLMPVGVVIAYKPQIHAKLTNEVYSKLQESHNAGGSVSIGPFSFGGSHSRSVERVTWDKTKGEVTVESESPTPLVVAVLCYRLNYSGQ